MSNIAQVVGILAVVTFLISYQLKERKNIILCNAVSRILYIVQYIMLGAFEGAILDVLGFLVSIIAHNKDRVIIRKHLRFYIILINISMFLVGLCMYKNIFSLCPVIGVMLHTGAFWMTDEATIRRVSFLGSPFWLIYNIASRAYGSALGDIFTMVSIMFAILRYDVWRKKNNV